jgi:hypothetical protein
MVLRALSDNITPELADKMDEYRRKEGNVLDRVDWYTHVPGVGSVSIPSGLITLKSNYFKIISTGKMKNMAQSLSGVIKRSGSEQKSFEIIKWRQD